MKRHEYVPQPSSLDDRHSLRPDCWLNAGMWMEHLGHGDHVKVGWSELSVKLALLGLNPPVLERLAAAVRANRQAKAR